MPRLQPRIAAFTSAFILSSLLISSPSRADFDACVSSLQREASGKGISSRTISATMSGLTPDMKVIESLNFQPEFKTPIWDYLSALADEERIEKGRALLRQHANLLAQVESRYGVDRHAVVAVWGVESDFGKSMGKKQLVPSLATLSCIGRRQAFFKTELMTLLKIIDQGHIRADIMGSWAGAFGHTQFMPTTFTRLAVDQDGDGRKDIVDSIPDALGSSANFLAKAGWNSGLTWGHEVRLPQGYSGPSGRTNRQAMSAWASRGITRIDGRGLSEGGNAALLLPSGPNGPAFLVTRNFDAIYSYNAAESYALAIAHLSDRLKGGGPFKTPWPTDDPGLSRSERRELQVILTRMGYDVGEPDGAIGEKTRAAIRDVEGKNGMRVSGRAGGKILRLLQR